MRLLVFGASGLVGGEISRRARLLGLRVCGAARSARGEATEAADLGRCDDVARLVAAFVPDAIAVAAAYSHVDGCELDPSRSARENVTALQTLLQVADATTRVALFSTDHVFDGAAKTYGEDAEPRPTSVYARHKLEAERLLLDRGRGLVVRTAWVFGEELRRKNFVYRVIDASRARTTLRVPRDQAGCPTWSRWLADETLGLLVAGVAGIAHLSSGTPHTKANWARLAAQGLSLPEPKVSEEAWAAAGQVAPRPKRVVLTSARQLKAHPSLLSVLHDQQACLVGGPSNEPR